MKPGEESSWAAAGRFDATHGLMPMASWNVSVGEPASAYHRGYRSVGRIGTDLNPYRDDKRPPS